MLAPFQTLKAQANEAGSPCSTLSTMRNCGSVDGLGQVILDAALKLKHTGADVGPASSHQHCGRDIHKSQGYDQDQREAGTLLRLPISIPRPGAPKVKVGANHQATPQRVLIKTAR
jgi:hypothetical protein